MKNFENEDFHIPFIKELIFVSVITIVSIVSVRFFIEKYENSPQEKSHYTSDSSGSLTE
jgi:hypothetical protein